MTKEPKDWFLQRLASNPPLDQEDIQQIARLIDWLDREREQVREHTYEAALNSAMIADICELLFGGNANGSPMLMCHAHAGWACGPISKPEGESYVRWMLKQWNKEKLKPESVKEIEEWEEFLKTLVPSMLKR